MNVPPRVVNHVVTMQIVHLFQCDLCVPLAHTDNDKVFIVNDEMASSEKQIF